jgi:hypothetical protein
MTMYPSTSNNVHGASFTNRSILGLNRTGIQHFQVGRFPEASEYFLSAIQTLKSTCSVDGESADLSNDDHDHDTVDDSHAWYQESTDEKMTAATRLGAVLGPISFGNGYFPSKQEHKSGMSLRDLYARYPLVGLVLIFNLASTIHHYALIVDKEQQEQQADDNDNNKSNSNGNRSPTVSRDILVDRALRLYQCAFDGVSSILDYTMSSSGLDKTLYSRQVVLRQQLLLSTIHNMGLLISSTEEERNSCLHDVTVKKNPNNNINNGSNVANSSIESQRPTSYRCFQVVFATLHSLGDYYGIQPSDFPSDFELQVVIDTALERLQNCPSSSSSSTTTKGQNAIHPGTAPCA